MRALTAVALLLGCSSADGDPRPSGADGPLVIELFTSQGCSSCPPADRLLAKLAADGRLAERALAPLSFHVDYWNDLGWADPFSLPAWSERQRQYAHALDGRVYTPELIVGGSSGVLGSSLAAVTQAVQRAAHPALLAATAHWTDAQLTVAATAPRDADVWVAVWEDSTTTRVLRGENAGETLGSARVVRRLERVSAAGRTGSVSIQLAPAWRAGGAVAFAQRSDRRIVAAVVLPRSAGQR